VHVWKSRSLDTVLVGDLDAESQRVIALLETPILFAALLEQLDEDAVLVTRRLFNLQRRGFVVIGELENRGRELDFDDMHTLRPPSAELASDQPVVEPPAFTESASGVRRLVKRGVPTPFARPLRRRA
jgi:hypothetical protein